MGNSKPDLETTFVDVDNLLTQSRVSHVTD